ncbi:MAG: radical SAM protein [Planctomycetota bacterium]
MEVLFVWTDVETNYAPTAYHIGVAYLSGALKAAGHKTSLLRFDTLLEKDEFLRMLDESEKPGMFAFSAMTNQFDYCARLATWTKEKWPEVPIIFGGHHPTLAADEVIGVPAVDMICLGEGEEALVEMVDRMARGEDCSDVRNFWIKRDGEIIKNDIRPLHGDINALPFMDLDIYQLNQRFEHSGIALYIMAGRGCPYQCTYCCNPAVVRFYKGKGKVVRTRTVDKVIEELKYHLKNYPRITYVGFQDETFTLDKKWVLAFCAAYKSEIGISFSAMVRADTLDEDIVRTMADAGCDLMRIGVESGSEWLRSNVLKRHMTNEQIINAFDLAEKYGIRSGAFAMMGLPYETPEMVEETIELLRRCNPNHLQLSIFYPLPGTELYDVCKREGFMTDEKALSYFDKPVLNLPTITREQISHYFASFHREFLHNLAKKESRGLYDFVSHFESAQVKAPSPDYVCLSSFIEEHPRRVVMQAHPPSTVTYRVRIPENAVLDFDILMAPCTYEMPGEGVRFSIKVNRKRVFRHYLDAKKKKEDRAWHRFVVDLKKFGGKEVDISFITETGPSGNNEYCIAGWGRPFIARKEDVPAE